MPHRTAGCGKSSLRPLMAGSSPSLPDGSNPSAAIVQSASDVQCSRLLKTTIKPFYQLHNRYQIELDALRLYLYLLSIRDNDEPYTKVSLAKVIEKTGIQLHEVPNAAALLHTIGLLSHSETTGFLFKSADFEKQSELYVFFFSYGEFLLRKPMPLKEIEKSIQLNDVQDCF
ncbi:hypothetical protein [Vibrio cholerae]|uniref:hypothetical protein n=1 Tax=Vibrio cholerae TaxID=666 RepID=UPI00155E1B4C|nr:hypothetical protein [Vibrio cholerae]EKF9156897.1 hypothetical protein [Vibrio cholerae]EKF9158113.1 hypothetical protein [Vibrio cholerae]EKF9387650.1 hypothetical protein [Vibrio cholerae]EKF9389165.1 hypothetical protein [Vibrio cholerae]EKF9823525.1 hypothetical protein [Vibrio cholerae]